MLNSSFDWNGIRQPYVVATENDSLNGVAMLFGHLLTNTAQIFSDVRTYWSPEAVKRVTGQGLTGIGGERNHPPDQLRRDRPGRHRPAAKDGKPAMKPFWEITPKEVDDAWRPPRGARPICGYFRGGGFSSTYETKGEMPVTMSRVNLVKGLGPVLQIAEG